jgi:hypothetical protein
MSFFDKSLIKSFMHLLYRGGALAPFLVDQDKELLTRACRKMEMVTMQIFMDYEWRWSNRICAQFSSLVLWLFQMSLLWHACTL